MTFGRYTVTGFGSLLAIGSLVAACSAGSEPSASSSEAMTGCIAGEPSTCHFPLPPQPACVTDTTCESGPKGTPGFDPAVIAEFVLEGNAPRYITVTDPAFAANLVAYGCTPEQDFQVKGNRSGSAFATSFCPQMFDLGMPSAEEWITCNTCTGEPPYGWYTVGWEISPINGFQPSTACGEMSCVFTKG
jgi:hypothetical protein